MDNNPNNVKINKSLIVVIVVLILALIGAGIYIAYDARLFSKDDVNTTNNNIVENNTSNIEENIVENNLTNTNTIVVNETTINNFAYTGTYKITVDNPIKNVSIIEKQGQGPVSKYHSIAYNGNEIVKDIDNSPYEWLGSVYLIDDIIMYETGLGNGNIFVYFVDLAGNNLKTITKSPTTNSPIMNDLNMITNVSVDNKKVQIEFQGYYNSNYYCENIETLYNNDDIYSEVYEIEYLGNNNLSSLVKVSDKKLNEICK